MIPTLLAAATAAVLAALAARRLERWNIGMPFVMVVAGGLVGLTVTSSVGAILNTTGAQRAAELILAVLLFVDATEVRGGRLWGSAPGLAARMLLVAMPLSIAAALAVGGFLFPALAFPVLLVLACVVMPIDFASSERVVRDRRLPSRMRSMLNVEGGYNDGIVSPLFLFALALAGGAAAGGHGPTHALSTAVPHALIAIAVGFVLGTLLGAALDRASHLGWTDSRSRRIVVLLAPVATYSAAVALSGNGFVAAFVCGISFRYVHRALVARRLRSGVEAEHTAGSASAALSRDFTLLEDMTSMLTAAMWFVVGIAGVYFLSGVDVPILVFCVLALTVLRVGPVLLALVGTELSGRGRLLAGLLGPRGTTTIVFGLLAFNGLPDGDPADTIIVSTVLCVVGSVLLHGFGSGPAIDRLTASGSARRRARARPAAAAPSP